MTEVNIVWRPEITVARSPEDGLFYWQAEDTSGKQSITKIDGKFKIQQCQTFSHNSKEVHFLYWTNYLGDLPGLWVCDSSYRMIPLETAAEQLGLDTEAFSQQLLRFLLPRKQQGRTSDQSVTLRGLRHDANYPSLGGYLANALMRLLHKSRSAHEQAAAIEAQLFESRGEHGKKLWLNDLLTKGSITILSPDHRKTYSFRFPVVPTGDGFIHGYVDPESNACLLFTSHSGKAWILIDFDTQQAFASGRYDIYIHYHTYFNAAVNILVDHALRHEADLFALYDQGFKSSQTIVSCRDYHIGHYLWNELTGLRDLEEVVADTPDAATALRHIYVSSFPIYCPLDSLIPILQKEVPLTEGTFCDTMRYTYVEKCQYIRICDNYISAALADKIRSYAIHCDWLRLWGLPGSDSDESTRRQHLLSDTTSEAPTARLANICIYLRINNRAPVNQVEFTVALIKRLLEEELVTAATEIYICGSNTNSGAAIRSHLETAEGLPDWVKEQMLARTIINTVKNECGHTNILSLVGAPINHELFVADRAELIVTPWGAGMAKTKWILNRTCFVHTSTWNLNSRNDLRIYDDTLVRENAAPDLYFPADCVAMLSESDVQELRNQDPEGFQLLLNGFYDSDPSRLNYRIDLDKSIHFICDHLPALITQSHC
jgi:hypothetical protein